MKKNCLFQYALGNGIDPIIEDTKLITKNKANKLWDKYYPDFIEKLEEGRKPQMAIWTDCQTNISYHTISKELDYQDNLEVKNGIVYKLEKKPIK